MADKYSHIRLDALQGTFELRVYPKEVNVSQPFDSIMEPYTLTGLVRVYGDTAYVSLVSGKIERKALKQFYETLAEMGINEVRWERRKHEQKIIKIKNNLQRGN